MQTLRLLNVDQLNSSLNVMESWGCQKGCQELWTHRAAVTEGVYSEISLFTGEEQFGKAKKKH